MWRCTWVLKIGLVVACLPAIAAINITCSSERGGRQYCQADTSGGAVLLHQISSAICRKGYSWDKDGNGIWVDHGCKADFAVGALGMLGALIDRGADYKTARTLDCSASDKKRHYCQADTRGGVRLLSGACVYGKSWGYEAGALWVDRECKGQFEIGGAEAYKAPEVPGTGHVWGAGNGLKTISCSSPDGSRTYCPSDTSQGAVLLRDLSGTACVRGETWGYDRRGIWVEKNCKGEFDTVFRESILK